MSNLRSFLGACFLPLAALCVLAAIAIPALLLNIPSQAARRFGPPAPSLGPLQRFVLAAQLLARADQLAQPIDPAGSPQEFHVELNEPVATIARHLQEQGLITDPGIFSVYLQYTGLDTRLQAGDFTLSPAQSPIQIAAALQDATPTTITFHVLAGWRAEEVAAALAASGFQISAADFLAAAAPRPEGYSFSPGMPQSATAEGFLFPGAYEIHRNETAAGIVTTLLNSFDAGLTPDIRQGFSAQGLTLYEGVILASIVEREAILDEEMPRIASVYLNRHAIGMKLDADPTVQYALGWNNLQNTWWTNPLSLDDLQVESPYNTYRTLTLPPGPICSPGLTALRAVAFPEQTPYYYFRAACDGSGRHNFATSFEEHQANACP